MMNFSLQKIEDKDWHIQTTEEKVQSIIPYLEKNTFQK